VQIARKRAASRGSRVPQYIHDFLDGKLSHLQEKADALSGASGTFVRDILALPPVGVFIPFQRVAMDRAEEWHYVFAWARHWMGLVTPRESELSAGDAGLEGLPEPYAEVLKCFDQVPFFMDPGGFIGPSGGLKLGPSADELSSIKMTIDAHVEAGGLMPSEALPQEELERLIPIMADGSGNYYLCPRGSTRLSFFDHELGTVGDTGKTLEDLLRTFWTAPGKWR